MHESCEEGETELGAELTGPALGLGLQIGSWEMPLKGEEWMEILAPVET